MPRKARLGTQQLGEQRAVAATYVDDVSSPRHSSEASCSTRWLAPSCIARSKKLVPRGAQRTTTRGRCRSRARKQSRPCVSRPATAWWNTSAEEPARSRSNRRLSTGSDAGVLRKMPGSFSAKTPSLASARRGDGACRRRRRPLAPAQRQASAVGEHLGDPQLGDDPERARAKCAAQEVPQLRLGRGLAHARAARTAAARRRRSPSSDTVRQSRSSRPSRTTPTTGGSPRRSGVASSSSTAHA